MKYTLKLIQELYLDGKLPEILPFYGHRHTKEIKKTCLSNWYDCRFIVAGMEYHTTEQYMMAQKALLFGDQDIYEKIMADDNPKAYKALGRKVHNFNPAIWEENKCRIVFDGCLAKFKQNPELGNFLKSTGDSILVEASPRDNIWGVMIDEKDPAIYNPLEWQGRNLLGFVLMEVRDNL